MQNDNTNIWWANLLDRDETSAIVHGHEIYEINKYFLIFKRGQSDGEDALFPVGNVGQINEYKSSLNSALEWLFDYLIAEHDNTNKR